MISPYVHHIHSILLCPIRNNKNALTNKNLLQKHIYYFRKQLHYLANIYYLAQKKVNFYNNLCKIQKKNMQQFNLNAKASIGQLTRKLIYIINRYSLLMAPLSIHLPLHLPFHFHKFKTDINSQGYLNKNVIIVCPVSFHHQNIQKCNSNDIEWNTMHKERIHVF